jgi:hypothetical protein
MRQWSVRDLGFCGFTYRAVFGAVQVLDSKMLRNVTVSIEKPAVRLHKVLRRLRKIVMQPVSICMDPRSALSVVCGFDLLPLLGYFSPRGYRARF